jgi:hypothetical protein
VVHQAGLLFFLPTMLNLFSFFKQQASEFKQDNKGRSADYIAGGLDALREAGDALTSHKDVVDLEWVTNQLNEAHKEARELRVLNKAFDEARRTFQSRGDLRGKEIEKLKSQLANHNRDMITAEVQSRADKQTGYWQSVSCSLRDAFYEAASILAGKEQDSFSKVQAASKVFSRALAGSTNRKHKLLAHWLLTNELIEPTVEKGAPQNG